MKNKQTMQHSQWAEAKSSLKTVRDWIRFGASCFQRANLFYGHGTDNAWDDAAALVLHALNLSHEFGDKLVACGLLESEKDNIIALFETRISRRLPMPYITHRADYSGFEFYVDERVLIPRSPMVELIENLFQPWIDPGQVYAIADIGTGSGCLAIICALMFPQAYVDAVDIDLNALEVAKINVEKYGLAEQVSLYESDLFSELQGQTWDVIISNPPYVSMEDMAGLPQEFLHEPRQALASGEEGLDHIKRILHEAKDHLNPGGILIAEVGNSQVALELAYPSVEFTWLEFQRGGEGVFLLTRDQLLTIL